MLDFKEQLKEYKAEMAKIEPKYFALADVIKGLEKLVNLDDGLPATEEEEINISFELGTFEKLSTKEAGMKVLYLAKRNLTSKQIASLLTDANYEHSSTNLANAINTALTRLQTIDSYVTRTDNKWSLTLGGEMYVKANLLAPPNPTLIN